MEVDPFKYMEIGHINQTFDLLHTKFGFPIKKWEDHFREYRRTQPRSGELESFMRFGYKEINPVLNKILLRRDGHPTFNKLVEYVIRVSASFEKAIYRR